MASSSNRFAHQEVSEKLPTTVIHHSLVKDYCFRYSCVIYDSHLTQIANAILLKLHQSHQGRLSAQSQTSRARLSVELYCASKDCFYVTVVIEMCDSSQKGCLLAPHVLVEKAADGRSICTLENRPLVPLDSIQP